MRPAIPVHNRANAVRARAAFCAFRSADEEAQRVFEIASLAVVEWKGRTLRTIRCRGVTGKGQHDVHVPRGLLWSLISLDYYICPYHQAEFPRCKVQGAAAEDAP